MMFANLAQPFWACLMMLSWSGLFALEVDHAVKEYVDGEEIDEGSRKEIEEMMARSYPPCDVPICTMLDCNDGGPPPFCPRNVTFCRSGCACIKYCKDAERTEYCYQVKFCRTPRRFSPDTFTTLRMTFGK